MAINKDDIEKVFRKLQNRELHPKGKFDSVGRFYLTHDLTCVREPSRAYPYSQMQAGRTKTYVKSLVAFFKIETPEELESYFVKNDNNVSQKPDDQQKSGEDINVSPPKLRKSA